LKDIPSLIKTGSDCEGVPGALEEEYEGKGERRIKGTKMLTAFSSDKITAR
jgi:hypothetical protein